MSSFGTVRAAQIRAQQQSGGASPAWGAAAMVFAQLQQAYAGYNAERLQSYELESAASAYGHQQRMLRLDMRAAELQAQSLIEQAQSEVANLTLEGGQRRAAMETSMAAAGVDSSAGSAREALVSDRLIDKIDSYHINLAGVRAANAARLRAVGLQNDALAAGTSADNLRRSARAARRGGYEQLGAGLTSGAIDAWALYNYRRA
jgi:hypothetical protein